MGRPLQILLKLAEKTKKTITTSLVGLSVKAPEVTDSSLVKGHPAVAVPLPTDEVEVGELRFRMAELAVKSNRFANPEA